MPALLAATATATTQPEQVPVPPDPGNWLSDMIVDAIGGFFKALVNAALDPMMDLLGTTLLSTPTPQQLPRIEELWYGSWEIVLAAYAILIAIGGVVVMAHESLQTRYTIKEIGPRVVIGFVAAAVSLPVATMGIKAANAVTEAITGPGAGEGSAVRALVGLVTRAVLRDPFAALIALAFVVMLLVLLITYVVRVALTLIMVAGAPLALACHALPQTEGIARWWWKVFGALLAIQVVQALALVTAVRLFLGSDSYPMFGTNTDALANLIVGLGLVYLLIKIPFWLLSAVRGSHRRSTAGGIVRAYVLGRTLGMLRGGGAAVASRRGGSGGAASGGGGASSSMPPGSSGPAPAISVTVRRPVLRRPPGQPLFLEPGQHVAGSPRQAIGPPGSPDFRSPDASEAAPATAVAPRPRATPPARAVFLEPISRTPIPPVGTTSVPRPPVQAAFQSPEPARPTPRPRRTAGPAPAATFRPLDAARAQPSPPPRSRPPGPIVPGMPVFLAPPPPSRSPHPQPRPREE